jgi:hypothetical protein
LHGRRDSNILAAAARWLVLVDADMLYVDRANRAVTHSDIIEYVDKHDELLSEAVAFHSSHGRNIDLQPSLLVATSFLILRANNPAGHEFLARVADGAEQRVGSPILALRSRLRRIREDKQRVEADAYLSMVIRTWNLWREGRTIASLPIAHNGKSIRCPSPRS